MHVRDVMMRNPPSCSLDTNLAAAVEILWNRNCGVLPVLDSDGRVASVITDRDICVALGTRNRPAGEVKVGDLMSCKLYSCGPEDDVHEALQILREGKVRRLPVIATNGTLVGVLSMDDILLRTEPIGLGVPPELSSDEVVRTLRMITQRQVPEVMKTQAATA